MTDVSRQILTPKFRMSYPNLLVPRPFKEGAKDEYSVEMIFDQVDMDRFQVLNDDTGDMDIMNVKQMCVEMSKEAWGSSFNPAEAVKMREMHWPVRNGDEMIAKKEAANPKKTGRYDHYEGMSVIRGKAAALMNGTPFAPRLYYAEKGQLKQINRNFEAEMAKAAAMFYGGAYATAEINVKTNTTNNTHYIMFYINCVRFVADGDRFGGQTLMERFSGVDGGQTDYDPTEGMTSEIP
jgi:hypothetical protein